MIASWALVEASVGYHLRDVILVWRHSPPPSLTLGSSNPELLQRGAPGPLCARLSGETEVESWQRGEKALSPVLLDFHLANQ